MQTQELLAQLRTRLADYSAEGAAAHEALLVQLEHVRVSTSAELIDLHELVLFLRAYPANPNVLVLCERILEGFSARVAALRDEGVDLTPLEETEVSGIAGSGLTAVFTYATARHLAAKHAPRTRIAWDAYDTPQRLGFVLPPALPLCAEDAEVEPHPPYADWIAAAAGSAARELPWLVDHIGTRERFDLLELPLRWDFADSPATRTHMRLPASGAPFFHTEPLIPRGAVDLASVTSMPPLPNRRLEPAVGRRMLRLAQETLAVRYRELHGFLWGDESSVVEVDAGRGVRFFFSSLLPEHRLPLRAYHAATLWKNGIPIGYFEGLSLFERMEAGFNLFYTFRAGETAWIYRQLLAACHQLMGVRRFLLDPYQIGHENEEAIASGAFWFYRKLGYRSVDPKLRALTAREERKLQQNPAYRSPPAVLRRLAARPLIWEMAATEVGIWDDFELRRALLPASSADASPVAGLGAARWNAAERRALDSLLPLLARIPGLDQWTPEDKRLLAQMIRAKAELGEAAYLRLMQRHDRFRAAILHLGSSPLQ